MKKFSKIIEKKEYYEELGYTESILSSLTNIYQLWTDAEGLQPLSADEHENLTPKQKKFISTFLEMWNIVNEYEKDYKDDNFLAKLKSKKYNL